MIPELPIAMLACARLGAIHSVVFSGFSSDSLCERISDCGAEVLITSNVSLTRGTLLPLKQQVDLALRKCSGVKQVVVVKRLEEPTEMMKGRDLTWDELMTLDRMENRWLLKSWMQKIPFHPLHQWQHGKPKGVLHTTAGYLLHCKKSFEWVFDYRDEEIFWCTEDLSWIIGHSYGLYGPLAAGQPPSFARGD